MFPLDDGAVNRIMHMHVPWTAARTSFRYVPGDKVHEVAGPEHRRRLPYGRHLRRATTRPRLPQCCANRATGSPAGPGTSPTATSDGASQARAEPTQLPHPCPRTSRVLVAQGALVNGQLEVTLAADGIEIARKNLAVHPPLAWAPDGAFLTIGYARPFPVSDEYTPPASVPPSLVDLAIHVGPLPPFDLDAELARILRHQ